MSGNILCRYPLVKLRSRNLVAVYPKKNLTIKKKLTVKQLVQKHFRGNFKWNQNRLCKIVDVLVTEYTHSVLLWNLCGSLKLFISRNYLLWLFCLECTTSQNHDDNSTNHLLKWYKITILLQEAYLSDRKSQTIVFWLLLFLNHTSDIQ